MKKYVIITLTAIAGLFLVGCDEQRDLYILATPMVSIEGDWQPSLGLTDMTMNATAIAYDASGEAAKSYFSQNNTTLPLKRGIYDIMIFNGLMYSEAETHLDDIFFRNTDVLSTFEAVAAEGTASKRLARADDEYIASNYMEFFTSAAQEQTITGDDGYFAKYKDGKNGYEAPGSYVEAELSLEPVAMNYNCHIIITLKNVSSAWSATAALYGFVGSALVHTRMPSHFYVTHHVNLNNKTLVRNSSDDRGTIESPVFVTFGPPVDAADNRYSVYLSITLTDGQVWSVTVDVTDQILPVIEDIKRNIAGTTRDQIPIVIDIDLGEHELPEVDPGSGGVGVSDWEDDEIIRVPIPKS